MTTVAIEFHHGLGDAVQLGIVLKHLRAYRPDWNVDVFSLRGKHSAFFGLCRASYHDQQPRPDLDAYDLCYRLDWHEQDRPFGDVPSTKVTRCLREVFEVQPDPSFFTYTIAIGDEAHRKAKNYLQRVSGASRPKDGRFPVMLLHYQGNTSQEEKNISHHAAFALCQAAVGVGLVPVILDWDHRSPLPDERAIFCPSAGECDIWGEFGSGDAAVLAALIEQSQLFIGIDSGPLHVAGATNTPTVAVWTRHFPAQYFDLAENVLHLVPEDWRQIGMARCNEAAEYFLQHYRYRTYSNLASAIIDQITATNETDSGQRLVRAGEFFVRRDNVLQDLVIVRDVFEEDAYRTRLFPSNVNPEVVLDIGAHIGTFAKLWHKRNPLATIVCVEACPDNLEALVANVGSFAHVVHAACTYEVAPVRLLNSIHPDCESTGGSIVVATGECPAAQQEPASDEYWWDDRHLEKVTLEELMRRFEFDQIDVLKLDCEGSEYSILGETSSLGRIRRIVGEYHGKQRWDSFRSRRFPAWDYGHMYDGGEANGIFHLANPIWPPLATSTRQNGANSGSGRRASLMAQRPGRELFDANYYEECKLAGLDYLAYGSWQENYGQWLRDALGLKSGDCLLDVGCACGSIAQGLARAGIHAHGIDVCEHMIRLGRERFHLPRLHVCDSINMHVFPNAVFEVIHSSQVAEYFRPELVTWILKEWNRVLAPGGIVWCVLDTEEQLVRRGRGPGDKDPRQLCVMPISWWREQFSTFWVDAHDEYAASLREHPQSFLAHYDWDWLVYRKPR